MKVLMESPAEIMKKAQEVQVEDEESNEPVPTAMELAMRQAMEKSQNGNTAESKRSRKSSQKNDEMDGILSRTLQHKVKTD